MMQKVIVFFFFVFFQTVFFGQDKMIEAEDQLVIQYNAILDSENDAERIKSHDLFYKTLKQTLLLPGAYEYPFDKLITISKLQPDDRTFKIFTWNLQNDAGSHHFFGLIQLNSKTTRNKSGKVIELVNQSGVLEKTENKSYTAVKWPGAVYYDLIPFKKGGNTYYTVAGWRGFDTGLTQKLLDVIVLQGESVKFGYPIFKMQNRSQRRVVFTFNGKISMLLFYDSNSNRFVFDHLAAQNNIVTENHRFYGPDGSYDAFIKEKKEWLYEPNYDARNNKKNKDLFYNPVTDPDVEK
jgi:hypothetical protein